jgi:predicted  nucleic acid-binding Zn-ribbon protein
MDIEKTMEFILNTQARLEASAQQHEERIAKLESSMASLTDLVGRLAQAEIRLVERLGGLAGRVDGMAERNEAEFQKLRELHAETEYKLNALIDTVDKLVRRNGHKE